MVDTIFIIHVICSITMQLIIFLLYDCSPFEALQSGIARSLVALHISPRKCGDNGDLNVIVLNFLLLFYYGCRYSRVIISEYQSNIIIDKAYLFDKL